ncbi:hypothetical protein GALL_344280 [mine drainage metagenome]|uniref:Uncharacterized protein n=1 Tax=mine drainage metagenome TaxID=410659 RepID=A0A1J5QJV6_9ZZZZ
MSDADQKPEDTQPVTMPRHAFHMATQTATELSYWSSRLQRFASAEMYDDDAFIMRGIAVRLEVLSDALYNALSTGWGEPMAPEHIRAVFGKAGMDEYDKREFGIVDQVA